MSAQDVIIGARAIHVRELQTQVSALKAENAALKAENESLKSHFHLAVLAASDLNRLPPGGVFKIYDGWNLVLGADKIAASRDGLEEIVERELENRPDDFAWIVYDGPKGNSFLKGRLRVSYTGGEGGQRADRMIADFVRMARMSGADVRIEVVTSDRGLRRTVERILSNVNGTKENVARG